MATTKKNDVVKTKKPKAVKVRKKMGRPSKYSDQLADEICNRMAEGESLLKICKDEHMPTRASIHNWLLATDSDGNKTYANFFDKYEIAVALRADHMFDQIEQIADNSEEVVRKGAEKKSSAYAQTQRLRVDSRKWYLSKIMPKKFSDKNVHVTEDEDGNQMPITGNVIQFAPQDKKQS